MPEYPQSWPMPKSPIPIVIFGAGSIVSDAHLPAYKFSNLPVKGIYDPDCQERKKPIKRNKTKKYLQSNKNIAKEIFQDIYIK